MICSIFVVNMNLCELFLGILLVLIDDCFFAGLLLGYCPLRHMCICTSFNEISMDIWMSFGSEICAF